MSASEIERTLVRLAHEVVEKLNGIENLGLVGIRRRGIPIAERLARHIERIEKSPVPVGTCSTPGAPSAPRWMHSSTRDARVP